MLGYGACSGYEEHGDEYGHGYGHGYGHAISAAIITKGHSIKSIPTYGDGGHGKTTHVNIDGGVAPIKMHFETKSSPIFMSHSHKNGGGSHHYSSSYDKPHVKSHTVYKPVISNHHEVIVPYQHHYQMIKPVKKSFHTSVLGHYGGHY